MPEWWEQDKEAEPKKWWQEDVPVSATTVILDPNWDMEKDEKQTRKILEVADELELPLDDIQQQYDSFGDEGGKQQARKIGVWEELKRADIIDFLEKLPFSPYRGAKEYSIVQAMKRLDEDDYEKYKEPAYEMTPMGGYTLFRPAITKEDDIEFLTAYQEKLKEEKERGYTWAALVGKGIAELPAWMVEIYLGGGVSKGHNILSRALIHSALQPHRLRETLALVETEDPEQSKAMTFAKSWGRLYFENLSELTGEYLVKGAKVTWAKLPFGSKFLRKVSNAWMKLKPGRTTMQFLEKISTRAGYNGILAEIGEERVNTLLQSITGVDDFGAGKSAGMLKRVEAGIKQDVKNLPVEVAVLSVPGATRYAIGKTIDAIRKDIKPSPVAPVKPPVAPPEAKVEAKPPAIAPEPKAKVEKPKREPKEHIIELPKPKETRKIEQAKGKSVLIEDIDEKGNYIKYEDFGKGILRRGKKLYHKNTQIEIAGFKSMAAARKAATTLKEENIDFTVKTTEELQKQYNTWRKEKGLEKAGKEEMQNYLTGEGIIADEEAVSDIFIDKHEYAMKQLDKLNALAKVYPEFAINPVFKYEDEMLVWKQFGETVRYRPEALNIDKENLQEGDTVRVDLESLGIKPPSKVALKKVAKLPFVDIPESVLKGESLPSKKIELAPKPVDHRQAGFVEIPPFTTVGKIEAEHPNIQVKKPQKDIGLLQNWILTSTNQAQNTGHPDIIKAANEMADTGMKIWQDIQSQLSIDKRIYNTLPKEYRGNKGEKFFALMDKHYDPEKIATADLPEDVKVVLGHFKLQDESMRQEIIKKKRAMFKAILMRKKKSDLQLEAENAGVELKYHKLDKEGEEILEDKTKSMIADELVETEDYVPDDWGLAWSHIQHIFFGQYELTWQEVDPETGKVEVHFIGRAETQTEAYKKLADWKEARRAAGFDDADSVQLSASPEFHIPFDVLRISRKHFHVLEKQIQEAADIERKEVEDGLRGIIGKRESKQKWWGALMHRKGAPEYSQDFWRVWSVQASQYNRWKHLSDMNRKVTPIIERIRGQGLRGWAQYLEDTKDFMWGRKRADAGRMLDTWLAGIPIIRNYVKPYAYERWTGAIKSVNYWRHLQTGRFYVLNSLQTLQTLWPVVGEKGLYRGIQLYYSKEGQDLLRQYKVAGISGKLHEIGMRKTRRFERYLPAGASEIRNQGIAFLALYDNGTKRGMSPADAAKYARLRGQLFTQFTYTQSDIPKAMRGPAGGLILQYKRFTIKNLELVSRLAREGNWGGVSRWMAAVLSIGGLKTITSPIIGLPGLGYLTYKLYKKIEDEYGKETADVVHHGLPGLVGIDMSGSVTPIDVPYGENIYEKTGNLIFGPTGTTAIKIIGDVQRVKVAKDIGTIPRALKSLVDSSPTVKQFVFLTKALQKDTANYDAKQRALYKLEVWDLWKKAFGFRAETESIQRMQFEAMMDLKQEYDEVIDHVVLALVDGDSKEAERLITDWHANFPEAPISGESIRRRLLERNLARMLPMTERAFKELPAGLKGAFVEEKK